MNKIAQTSHRWKKQAFIAISSLLIILVPVTLQLKDWILHPEHGPDRPAPQMAYIQLEIYYQQAVDLIADELASQPSPPLIAAGDVGVIGYYSGARILDTVGLNSPVSTRYYPLDPSFYAINYAIPTNLILDQKPDYLIILEVYGRLGLLRSTQFQENYHLLHRIPTDIYGSDGLLIFRNKGFRSSPQ
jgi:hypothetical protein